jgi:SAM-dependent methyltransferase
VHLIESKEPELDFIAQEEHARCVRIPTRPKDPAPRPGTANGGSQDHYPARDPYDRHVGRYSPELARALISVAGVVRGQRALDVGCGTGALAEALAEALGADSVAAIDPSRAGVDKCARRVPGADVRVGRAEALPFGDGGFDAALAQLVVPWMSDPAGGAAEMRRVVRPGGIVAACTWDFAGGMTMLRTFWDAAVAVDRRKATQAGALDRTRLCNPAELRELWTRIGLLEIDAGELVVGADYADFDDFWWPFSAGAGGSGRYCASLGEAGREALRGEVHRRLGSPAGPFRLTARAWYVRGRRQDADRAAT